MSSYCCYGMLSFLIFLLFFSILFNFFLLFLSVVDKLLVSFFIPSSLLAGIVARYVSFCSCFFPACLVSFLFSLISFYCSFRYLISCSFPFLFLILFLLVLWHVMFSSVFVVLSGKISILLFVFLMLF